MQLRRVVKVVAAVLMAVSLLSGCDWFVKPQERIERAQRELENGNNRAAAIELQNALKKDPQNIEARLLLADVSLRMGDSKSADKELERALSDGASAERVARLNAEVRLALSEHQQLLEQIDSGKLKVAEPERSVYRGLALLGLGDTEAALQTFDAALKIDSTAPGARLGKARAYLTLNRLEDALNELNAALQVDPTDARSALLQGTIHTQRGDHRAAIESLQRARKNAAQHLDPAQYGALLALLTQAYVAAGDVKAAQATQKELAQSAPDSPLVHFLSARIAMAQQNYQLAVSEAQRALAGAPDQAPIKLLLGAALLANGNLNQAEAQLGELVQSAPENVEARKLLAQVNLRLNHPDAALQALTPLQDSQVDDPQLGILLGRANLQKGAETAAISHLERSVAAQPESSDLKLELALAYISGQQHEKAIELLSSLQSKPGDVRRETLLIAAMAAGRGAAAARAEVERIVAANVADVNVLNVAALFLAEQRDFPAARALLKRALTIEEKNARTLLNLARVETGAGDSAAAKAALDRMLAVDPNSNLARNALADWALKAGDAATAVKYLEQVRRADPKALDARLRLAALYMRDKKPQAADEVLGEALIAAEDKAMANLAVGRLYLEAGRYDEALARFRDTIDVDPRNREALVSAARAQIALGSLPAARESVERARAVEPDAIDAVGMLIALELRDGRNDRALELARELRGVHPADPTVALIEGDAQMSVKAYGAAAEAYARAYELSPSGMAAVRSHLARRAAQLPRSTALLEQWIQTNPQDGPARMVLAGALAESGQTHAAVRHYEILAARAQPSPMVLNNLAWHYFELGDPRASAMAKRAYELSPEEPAIADTHGWLLVQAGQVTQGLAVLERAVARAQGQPDIRYHYAAALAGAGQSQKARAELTELIRTHPQFASAADARKLLADLEGAE